MLVIYSYFGFNFCNNFINKLEWFIFDCCRVYKNNIINNNCNICIDNNNNIIIK